MSNHNKCECDNGVTLATIKLYCKTCNSTLEKIAIKKPLKTAGIAALIAFSTSHVISYAVTDNRYPLAVKYEILDSCISSSQQPLSGHYYRKKKELCLCAMEDTMNQISSTRKKITDWNFVKAFEENAQSCKE